jgi:hypothetical protein
MSVFFIRSVCGTIFGMLFLPKPPADRSLINTVCKCRDESSTTSRSPLTLEERLSAKYGEAQMSK